VNRYLFLLLLSAALPAYGYIDPGTGSLIIQSIIGAIAAIGVTLKIYWHKLKVFFSKGSEKNSSDKKDEASEEANSDV
jgi:DUF1365 family protein